MSQLSSRILLLAVGALALALTALRPAEAQSSDGLYRSTPLGLYPPNIGFGSSGPMVMLTASKDHTLFSPIYTDYEDIDGDGTDDFTFKPNYTYYGYFDASKCYAYNAGHSTGGRFEPVALANASGGFLSCEKSSGRWSGNFLNWATMTRIDVVRKTLYGGKRVEDTASDTTLEMAQMATDAHSFVKYYSGADLKHFTPFDQATDMEGEGLTICNRGSDYFGFKGFPMMRLAKGNYSLWATIRGEVCNWKEERATNDQYRFGEKVRKFYDQYGPSRGAVTGDPTSHKVELPTKTTLSGVAAELAVRVQVCKPDLLGKERCKPHGSGDKVVYKPMGLLQEFAATEVDTRPARAEFGLITGSYDSNLKGGFLRKNMGSINDELDRDTGRFCHRLSSTELTSVGSRCKTTSGIVRAFDEIRLYSAGDYNNALQPGADRTGVPNTEFLRPQDLRNGDHASWGNPMSEMIVQALAYFAGDAASQQTILGMGKTAATGRDKEVGLPSDVPVLDPLDDSSKSIDPASGLLRSKLYGKGMCRPMHVLAISSGTVSFDTDEAGSNDDVYDAVTPFFSRVKSTDTLASLTHQVGDNEGISGTDRSVGSVNGGFGQDCTVKGIGTVVSDGLAKVAGVCPEAPGIKGSYLGAGAALAANTRAIRPVDNGSVTVGGTTLARDKLPSHALRVKTYAASLAGGVARIEVPVGDTGKKVYITPESSWRHDGFADSDALMPGAMLTFRALDVGQDSTNPKRRFGSYVVTWNDAQFGGDYDEDLTGFIRWEIAPMAGDPTAYELKVMTDVFAMSAGAQGSHGFSIVGVDAPPSAEYKGEGRHLTHGANGFASVSECKTHAASNPDLFLRLCSFDNRGMRKGNAANYDGYAWPTTFKNSTVDFVEKGGTSTTVVSRFKVTAGTEGVTLRDPLWYIAKYGSFDTGEKPNEFNPSVDTLPESVTTPGTSANWDRQDNANPDCAGASCADGEPDGYFLARRPELLETRLRQLLGNIAATSNAAPAVSSTQLLVGKLKFQSEFARNEFSGTVKAFQLNDQGVFAATPSWDAGKQMEAAGSDNRRVITNVGQAGHVLTEAFVAGETGQPYLKALLGLPENATPTAAQVDQGKTLVGYLRGSRDAEDAKLLRVRGTKGLGIMGPVVSSSPWVQDHEFAARWSDGIFPSGVASYRSFVADKAKGESVLWVGSNDGMLHAVKVSDGSPVLSYVPSPLVGRLSTALSAKNSSDVALMDGSPFTADVLVPTQTDGASTKAWRTYLFSSLGRGGRALFALDVTLGSSMEGGLKGKAADELFRWVFTAEDDAWAPTGSTPASDLGYNVQDPVKHPASTQPASVVYLNDGNFWLLHPNGHRSDSGRAVLFLFKMTGPGGAPWRNPETGATNGYTKLATRASDTNNGLMGVTWVDLDNNETADLVYGTDLKGQLWRFDLRDRDPNNWRVGLYDPTVTGAAVAKEGVPLFTAKDSAGKALPIMAAPAATLQSYGGVMLSFGTGLALETGDFPDVSRTQRFFTVWDRGGYVGDRTFAPAEVENAVTKQKEARPLPLPDLSRLTTNQKGESVKTFIQRFAFRDEAGNVFLAQTNEAGEVVTDLEGKPIPLGPVNSAQRFDPSIHDGWFFEFPDGGAQGEAVLSSPGVRSNFVFFTSVRGQTTQEQELSCSQQPASTLYALSPVNGLPVNSLLVSGAYYLGIPVNDQKLIAVRDLTGDPKEFEQGEENPEDPDPDRCTAGTVAVRVVGGAGGTSRRLCVPATSLRIQWRELPGLRTQ